MNLIFLGAPGSGKGTQAKFVSEKMNIPTISVGDMLFESVKNGTSVGRTVKEYMNRNEPVPNAIVVGILKNRIAEDDAKNGFILDGFPKTVEQAQALEDMGVNIDLAIEIDVPDERVSARLGGRRVCDKCGTPYHIEYSPPKVDGKCDSCGGDIVQRIDDEPETFLSRLKTYHEETAPLLEFYRKQGKLKTVKGQEEISDPKRLTFEAIGCREDSQFSELSVNDYHSITPPSRPSASEIEIYCKYFNEVKKNINNPKVLILGSTPELRMLAFNQKIKATIIDKSEHYYSEITNGINNNLRKRIQENETLILISWQNMSFTQEFDIIIGDMAIGNVPPCDIRKVLANIANALKPNGYFLGKSIYSFEKRRIDLNKMFENYYTQKKKDLNVNPYESTIYELTIDSIDDKGKVNFNKFYRTIIEYKNNGKIGNDIFEAYIGDLRKPLEKPV